MLNLAGLSRTLLGNDKAVLISMGRLIVKIGVCIGTPSWKQAAF